MKKKVRTWRQLLSDPRVETVWTEDNDGKDYWIQLAPGWECDGCVAIHEWSKAACIEALNSRIVKV